MRLRYVLPVLFLMAAPALAQEAPGTWALLPASPTSSWVRFEDGSFIDARTGWIVNGAGEVWRTGDGGASWEHLASIEAASGYPIYLRSAAFVNEQHGFIGTLVPGHTLYETVDGGATWANIEARVEGPLPTGICGIWAVDEETIYAAGIYSRPARFLKTTDGGQTWTSRDMSEYADSLIDVYFWDAQRGLVVGGIGRSMTTQRQAVILLTEDGGETWSVRHTTSRLGEWGWKISFPTPTTGYVSVEDDAEQVSDVLKSTDGGLTWASIRVPGHTATLQGVGFVSEDVGWVSGRGQTSVTTDGGASWERIPLDGLINRFRFLGDTLGYAMGARIHKYTRGAGTPVEEGAPALAGPALGEIFPNPFSDRATVPLRQAEPGPVEVGVYDLLGRRVAVLQSGFLGAGEHAFTLEGEGLPAGVYVVRAAGAGPAEARRAVVVR